MNQETLNIIIEEHEKWLRGECDKYANLRDAKLSYANETSLDEWI